MKKTGVDVIRAERSFKFGGGAWLANNATPPVRAQEVVGEQGGHAAGAA
jgi:hypothetical protein